MTPPAPVESDVSTGEIGRRLDRFEGAVTSALSDISGKLDLRPDWADVRRIEKGLQEQISRLEDWQRWAGRIIIGAVILAVLGVVLVARPPG
jgi:hypothetical protein